MQRTNIVSQSSIVLTIPFSYTYFNTLEVTSVIIQLQPELVEGLRENIIGHFNHSYFIIMPINSPTWK